MKSLERGNLQFATFQVGGKEEKLFITPNVEFKTLSTYNHANQRISLKDLFQKEEQTIKKELKPEQTEKQVTKKEKTVKQSVDKLAAKRSKKQRV